MERVERVTPDGVLALLIAVVDANEHRRSITGNTPLAVAPREMIENTGFADHVRHTWLPGAETGKLHWSGDSANTGVAKQLVDFAAAKLGVQPKAQRYVYKMLLEFMANTANHALEGYGPKQKWFVQVYWDAARRTACFCFADNGRGVVNTLFADTLRATRELARSFLRGGGQNGVLLNVLAGAIKSTSKKPGRGLGLPRVAKLLDDGHIQRLVIFTNKAHVDYEGSQPLGGGPAFRGTLIYWEVQAKPNVGTT